MHKDGDILLVADFQGNAATVGVYRWTGSDATGTLTAVTPPANAVYLFVNSAAYPVPWSFVDASGFTVPWCRSTCRSASTPAPCWASVPKYTDFFIETLQ